MFVSFGFCDSFYPLCDECSIPVFTPQHQFRHCIASNRQIMNNESTTKTYSPLDIYFARFELNQSLHKVPSNKLWSKHDGTVRWKKHPGTEQHTTAEFLIEFHSSFCRVPNQQQFHRVQRMLRARKKKKTYLSNTESSVWIQCEQSDVQLIWKAIATKWKG